MANEKKDLEINVNDTIRLQDVAKLHLEFEREVKREINKFGQFPIFNIDQVGDKHLEERYFSPDLFVYQNFFLNKIPQKDKEFKKSEEIVENKKFREALCPHLMEGVKNIFDLVKTLVPVFVGANIVGSLPFTITPFIAATVIVFIAKMGVNVYCKEYMT